MSPAPRAPRPTRGVLRARRVGARVLVQHGHPDPERVRRRVDAALGDDLRRALAAACAARFDERDGTVWVIRRLAFQVVVDAAWDPGQLARAVASHLTRAVERALANGGDGVDVVRFRDRAEHLACFVAELARGTAWSRWYFDAFDGVRVLP